MKPDAMRVYFLGAGASKQDGFPLTAELKHGIAWAIEEDGERFAELSRHLEYLYNVNQSIIEQSALVWNSLKQRTAHEYHLEGSQLPDVTDLLSTLDWTIREQSSFGPGLLADTKAEPRAGEPARVRDLVVQALCVCLGSFDALESASTTRDFMQLVDPHDSLITTNWDLLLDAARDVKFGSEPIDYGTSGNVVLEHAMPAKGALRPGLLKLHGSLSWRYCPRCQRLVIDPRNHVAGDRTEAARCECTCRFSELIVTPGFVREYRNVHLLTIWRQALLVLARSAEWVFVGYSLPPDDVGIRALLLKARCMRQDLGQAAPRATIVTGPERKHEVLARYRGILPEAVLAPDDFSGYVRRAGAAAS